MKKIKVMHEGKLLVRETKRDDVTHVMVAKVSGQDFAIVGLHKSEANAKSDVRNCSNSNLTERTIYAV